MAGQTDQQQIHLVQPIDMTHDDDENEDDHITSSENVKTRQTAATLTDEAKYGKDSEPNKN